MFTHARYCISVGLKHKPYKLIREFRHCREKEFSSSHLSLESQWYRKIATRYQVYMRDPLICLNDCKYISKQLDRVTLQQTAFMRVTVVVHRRKCRQLPAGAEKKYLSFQLTGNYWGKNSLFLIQNPIILILGCL